MARKQHPKASRRRRPLLMTLVVLALAAWAMSALHLPRTRLEPRTGPALAEARSWGYQLQGAQPAEIPAGIDVLVTDYSTDGRDVTAVDRERVAQFRKRSDGRPRVVLGYMSIGEAESFRYYWSPLWQLWPPRWLGPENKDWQGHYVVRYWDAKWQRVIFDPRPSALRRLSEFHLGWMKPYLDRIIDAGFDGVYLDRVDAYESWKQERPGAEREMMEMVKRLAAYARQRRPGFLIVPQNAEDLLQHDDYRAVIDAVAKEDLLFGLAGDGTRNSDDDVQGSLAHLEHARKARLPVFVVEYLADAEHRFDAGARLGALGFVPLFAHRQLDRVPEALPWARRD